MRLIVISCTILLCFYLLSACSGNSEKQLVGVNPDQPSGDSLMEGEKSAYYENGKLHYIVEYQKGKANGRVREYSLDGKLYMDAIYKDGHRNGKCSHFYKNGNAFEVADYVDGKKDGILTKYRENGKVWSITTYRNNKVQPGLREFRPDGTEIPEDVKILVSEIDHTALEGKYFIRVSLSSPRKDVKFFASPQSDPDSREILKMSGNSGILEVPLSVTGFVMKKLIFEAEYKTPRGNTMRLQKFYNLAVDK